MRHIKQFPAKNEDGLVALFVVGIMIILLSLTTVAFTKLMSRESRQALDRALSAQAYYAAETGLNDAKDYINAHPGKAIPTSANPCDTWANLGYPPYLGPVGSVAANVNKVTCVTADTTPRQLQFTIQPGQSQIFQISSSTGLALGSTLFSWDNANAPYSPANMNNYRLATDKNFYTDSQWNLNYTSSTQAPVLEVSYYPVYPAPLLADLPTQISRSRTIYLYPSIGNLALAPSYTYNSPGLNPDGSIITKTCQSSNSVQSSFQSANNVYHCNAKFSYTGAITSQRPVQTFVKVTSFYGPAKLLVMALKAPSDDGFIDFQNAQIVLDSTGKGGSDVLKRLQTVIDYHFNEIEANDAIESALGLCKRLEYNLTTGTAQVDPSANPSTDPYTSTACHTLDNPNQVDPL